MALERALRELLNVRPPYARLVALLLSFGPICHNVWGKWYRAAQPGARMHLWQAQFVTGGKRPIFGSSGQFRSSAATLDGKSGPACFLPRAKVTALCESDQRFLTGKIFNSHLPCPSHKAGPLYEKPLRLKGLSYIYIYGWLQNQLLLLVSSNSPVLKWSVRKYGKWGHGVTNTNMYVEIEV